MVIKTFYMLREILGKLGGNSTEEMVSSFD